MIHAGLHVARENPPSPFTKEGTFGVAKKGAAPEVTGSRLSPVPLVPLIPIYIGRGTSGLPRS